MTDQLIPAEVVAQACGHLYGSDHPHPFSRQIDDLRRDGVRRALEAALPALATAVAADHAAARRAIGCYLGVDSVSLEADARALIDWCTRWRQRAEAAEADRKDARVERDLMREQRDRLAGDIGSRLDALTLRAGAADPTDRQPVVDLDRQLREVLADRYALVQRIQHAREILTRAATCHSDNRIEYIDEADQVLSLGGAE